MVMLMRCTRASQKRDHWCTMWTFLLFTVTTYEQWWWLCWGVSNMGATWLVLVATPGPTNLHRPRPHPWHQGGRYYPYFSPCDQPWKSDFCNTLGDIKGVVSSNRQVSGGGEVMLMSFRRSPGQARPGSQNGTHNRLSPRGTARNQTFNPLPG